MIRENATGRWQTISGFFEQESEVRAALNDLLALGVPRDLIEVVVDEKDVEKFFGDTRVRKLNSSFSSAAKGALTGLILFALISAALIVSSGANNNERLTWIMLLGPNIGVMLGAIVGLGIGLFTHPHFPERYARLEKQEGILLVVRSREPGITQSIQETMARRGANSVEVE